MVGRTEAYDSLGQLGRVVWKLQLRGLQLQCPNLSSSAGLSGVWLRRRSAPRSENPSIGRAAKRGGERSFSCRPRDSDEQGIRLLSGVTGESVDHAGRRLLVER